MGQCKDILLLLFAAVDACNPTNPCNNGGTCVVTDNSFNCTCPPGIGGQNCTEGKCRQVLVLKSIFCYFLIIVLSVPFRFRK